MKTCKGSKEKRIHALSYTFLEVYYSCYSPVQGIDRDPTFGFYAPYVIKNKRFDSELEYELCKLTIGS